MIIISFCTFYFNDGIAQIHVHIAEGKLDIEPLEPLAAVVQGLFSEVQFYAFDVLSVAAYGLELLDTALVIVVEYELEAYTDDEHCEGELPEIMPLNNVPGAEQKYDAD